MLQHFCLCKSPFFFKGGDSQIVITRCRCRTDDDDDYDEYDEEPDYTTGSGLANESSRTDQRRPSITETTETTDKKTSPTPTPTREDSEPLKTPDKSGRVLLPLIESFCLVEVKRSLRCIHFLRMMTMMMMSQNQKNHYQERRNNRFFIVLFTIKVLSFNCLFFYKSGKYRS